MAYSSSLPARTPSSAPMLSHVTQAPFSFWTQFSTQPWSRQTTHRRSRRASLLQRGQCWRPSVLGFTTGDLHVHVVLPAPSAEPCRLRAARRPVASRPDHGLVLQRSRAARAWRADPMGHVDAVDLQPLQTEPIWRRRGEVYEGRRLRWRRPGFLALSGRDRADLLECADAVRVEEIRQTCAHVSPRTTRRCPRQAAPGWEHRTP